jgi:ribosomal protein L22
MADEETPEQKPKRRRRRKAEDESAPEALRASGTESEAAASDASASDADSPSPEAEADELEPPAADEAAEEEAADVVLEAEAEADSEPEQPAPSPARPTTAAPTRRRARRDPNAPPPVVRAHAKYVRSSARKARLVCDHIRGKSVDEARAILAHTPRAVARDWSKLLESAIANAENNHELVGEDLYVKVAQADEGPTLKRFRPRAMGRATRIRKRTSHLTILLTPKE